MKKFKKYDVRNVIYRKRMQLDKNYKKPYILYLIVYIFLAFPIAGYSQLLDSLSLDTVTAYTDIHVAIKDSDNVLKLDLSKQKLTEFPKAIRRLTNLQYLDLSKNKITEVPTWIGELKDLQVLVLSKNKIDSLPPEFGDLSNLKYLIMNRSELQTLPHTIGKMKELRGLDLWGDNMSRFPYELKEISGTLQTLDLRDVDVSDNAQAYLKGLLPNTIIYFSPGCACEQ